MRRFHLPLAVAAVMLLGLLVTGWHVVGTLAQEGTPAASPESAPDEPEGVTFEVMSAAPVETLPSAPAEAVLLRITVEPGAILPAPNDPAMNFVYVEAGTATVRRDAPVGVGRDAQFDTLEQEPFEQVAAGTEFPVGPGDAFVVPPLAAGELHNDGQENVVLLVTVVISTGGPAGDGAGTPVR